MKKHLIAVFIAVITCLAALSGCSLAGGFERDLHVVFEVNGEYVDAVTVNIFNNAIAPEFDDEAEGAVPDGYKFMGWSASHEWKYGDDRDLLISSGGIVRYDSVKDWANEGGTAVAVPVIIDRTTIPRGDIVIAWYSNSGTSGINDEHIEAFEAELRAYLAQEGYDVGSMDIVIRGYGGNVGTSCGNIRKDDDVDIMLGWANTNNLTGTGSMEKGKDVFENASNIKLGSKDRYAALCVDRDLGERELGVKVYDWIREKYAVRDEEGNSQSVLENLKPVPVVTYKVTFNSNGGSAVDVKDVESGKTVQKPADPAREGYAFDGWYTDDGTFEHEYNFSTPVTGDLELYAKWTEGEPEPAPGPTATLEDTTLVVSIWAKNGDWVTADHITAIKKDFAEYLKQNYANGAAVSITWREETETGVAALGQSVKDKGDVDFVMGAGNNINATSGTTAGLSNLTKLAVSTGKYMNSGRYVAVLNKDNPNQLAVLLYEFISGEKYPTDAA